jgi:threonine/homoserine/homoserine lactone efflux protein
VAFATLTFAIKGPIGFVSGMLSFWIQQRPAVLKYVHRTSGAILIALGLKLAFEKR